MKTISNKVIRQLFSEGKSTNSIAKQLNLKQKKLGNTYEIKKRIYNK